MPKPHTRAEIYGVKPGMLGAKSKRLLLRAHAAIAELSAAWDESYQPVAFDAEQLLLQINALTEVVDEGVSYLRESFGGADA